MVTDHESARTGVGSDPAETYRHSADAVLTALDGWLGPDPARVPRAARAEAVARLQQVKAKVAALELRLLSASDDVARAAGHRDAAAWYAVTTRSDPGTARAAQRTAQALRSAPQVSEALGSGRLSERHARAVLDSLDRLPQVPGPVRDAAEARLVQHAQHLPPRQVAARGKGILDEVDPQGRHRHLGTTLADEARRAWAAARLSLQDCPDGTTRIEGVVPTPVASRLKTVLHALTSPRRSAGSAGGADGTTTGTVAPVAYETRLGQALCTVLENLDPAGLPQHGGTATTLLVTIDHRDLLDELGTARIADADSTPVSASEARRLACGAGIVPAVLGSASTVLDLGRRTRLFTSAQVTALRALHSHCQAEGCTIPAAWCEAHHTRPWSQGGTTDLANAVLLCSHHHHRVHDPAYQHERGRDLIVRFRLRRPADDDAPTSHGPPESTGARRAA